MIKQLDSPMAKLLMSNKLIGKLKENTIEINPLIIHNIIHSDDLLAEERNGQSWQSNHQSNKSQVNPRTRKRHHFRISDLNDKEYIDFLRIAFEAYVDAYHLKDIIDTLKHKKGGNYCKQNKTEISEHLLEHDQTTIDFNLLDDLLEKHGDDLLEKNGDELLGNADKRLVCSHEIANEKSLSQIQLQFNENQFSQYQKDIKYYKKIMMMVRQAKNNYFEDWFDINN